MHWKPALLAGSVTCTGIYCMVGNFREVFIFAFFASQEPFAKIKTAKILLPMCKVNEPHFNPWPSYFYTAAYKSVSAMCLWWLSLKLSKMLCKHRRTIQTAAQGRERKQSPQVPDSLITKIKTAKISEIGILAYFAKITNHTVQGSVTLPQMPSLMVHCNFLVITIFHLLFLMSKTVI